MSLKRLTSRSPSGLRPEFRTGHEVPKVDVGPLRAERNTFGENAGRKKSPRTAKKPAGIIHLEF